MRISILPIPPELQPKMNISFFMPAYNCANTVAESVASILEGNLGSDDELVIVNDASTDRTKDILEKLALGNTRIRIIHHEQNKGGAAARNTAIEHCRHPLLFCLDSDNILVPGSVPRLKEFLMSRRADIAAFGELHYFKTTPEAITHQWRYQAGPITIADHLAGAVVPGASGNYLFTRESWERAGGYPESSGALDTWGFAFRQLVTGSKMLTLPGTHYFHRYGHKSYWVRDSKTNNMAVAALKIIRPFLDRFEPEDVDYLLSDHGRYSWFDNLDTHPIRVKGSPPGRPGEVIPISIAMTGQDRGLIRKTASAAKELLRLIREIRGSFL